MPFKYLQKESNALLFSQSTLKVLLKQEKSEAGQLANWRGENNMRVLQNNVLVMHW